MGKFIRWKNYSQALKNFTLSWVPRNCIIPKIHLCPTGQKQPGPNDDNADDTDDNDDTDDDNDDDDNDIDDNAGEEKWNCSLMVITRKPSPKLDELIFCGKIGKYKVRWCAFGELLI